MLGSPQHSAKRFSPPLRLDAHQLDETGAWNRPAGSPLVDCSKKGEERDTANSGISEAITTGDLRRSEHVRFETILDRSSLTAALPDWCVWRGDKMLPCRHLRRPYLLFV